MKVINDEKYCALSGRVYTTITYLAEPHLDETTSSISLYISTKHGDTTDREYTKEGDLFGFKVRIIKTGAKKK